MSATATPAMPGQSDPFAALGAQYETPVSADGSGTATVPVVSKTGNPDPFAELGAEYDTPSVSAPKPSHAPPAPPVATPAVPPSNAPLGATVERATPSAWENLRETVADSAIGHALESGMPAVSHALHLEPTETYGSPEYEQHGQQLVNPAPLVRNAAGPDLSAAIPHGVNFIPHNLVRQSTAQPRTPAQQVLTGAAETVGGMTTAPNLLQMAAPIGEAAGIFGKAAETVVPRLVSAGFSAQMIHGLYSQAQEYKQAKAVGDDGRAEEILGEMAVTAPMLFMAGAHAAGAGGHAAPEIAEHETPEEKETSIMQPQETREVVPRETTPTPTPAATARQATPPETSVPAALPIGAEEPETGRPVLQQSPRAEVNQAAATAEHPAVKEQLESTVGQIQGAKLAGARDEKTPERVEEKIEDEGQSPRTLRDYSGFRIAVDSPAARDAVAAALRKQFEVPDEQDEFDKGNEETGFHGLTLQVREPGSPVSHEVQILPREVAESADERHGLYEKAREGDHAAMAQVKAVNEADYQKFLKRNQSATAEEGGRGQSPEQPAGEPKFKAGSTQANIPEQSEAAQGIKALQAKIAPEDLAGAEVNGTEGGMETHPHVTVRYGVKGDDTEALKRFIESQQPFEAKLGPTATFPATESSEGAVPVIAPVESPELHRINAEIEKHGDFEPSNFPEYKPHATVAYVKPGTEGKYTGLSDAQGKRFLVDKIAITDRNGNQTEVPLRGAVTTEPRKTLQPAETLEGGKNLTQPVGNAEASAEPGHLPSAADGAYTQGSRVLRYDFNPDEAWEGFDLDKTLAHDDGFKGPEHIGKPIPEAIERLKQKLDEGKKVRILTARVAHDPDGQARAAIEDWVKHNIGQELPVTAVKDANMTRLYDDRAATVEPNTGRLLSEPQMNERGEHVQERGAGGVLQPPQEEAGRSGSGRGRVEPGVEGREATGAQQEKGAQAAGEVKPAADLKPNQTARVPVSELHADPKRFQYKMSATSAAGTTDLLHGRAWNDALAGVISVWRDPVDGKVYVVNGHHRFELASGSKVPTMNVLMLDAPDAETARSIGALQNIAEGRGTPMDAAKFFRDSGYTPADLDRVGVSMGEATAANGIALSRLADPIFDDVVTGKLRVNRAIAIGKATDSPEEQEAILKLIEKAESKGRKVSDDTVDELARMAHGAGSHTDFQETLFGTQAETRNLALEKAEVSSYIREQIGKEKRVFGSVADEKKAAQLGTAGNKINAAENRKIAANAAQAQELYDRLSTRAGAVDEILNRAAGELADGKETPNAVKQRAYEDARKALSETLGGAKEGQPGGLREGGTGNAPAPANSGSSAASQRSNWIKGEHFLVRDPATGDFRRGEVTFYNPGTNGGRAGGRSRLSDGTKLDEIPRDALRIVPSNEPIKNLTGSPEEADVNERVTRNLPKLAGDYLERFSTKGVPTLATDAAKELLPEFKADPTGNDRIVANAAKAIRDSAMTTVLSEPVNPEKPLVRVTTASPGSGKTSGQMGGIFDRAALQAEAISDDYRSFSKLLRKVLDSGRTPAVEWIYVDEPGKTVERMFRRAIGHGDRPGIGRTVQLKYMADAYHNVPRVLEQVRDEFGDRVKFVVQDNSGKPGEATAHEGVDALDRFVAKIKAKSYNEIRGEINETLARLEREGTFEGERGKAILEAARATDQGTSGGGSGGSVSGGGTELGQEAGRRPAPAGALLNPDTLSKNNENSAAEAGRETTPGQAVSAEEYARGIDQARKRTLRENVAAHKAQVADTPAGKAVVLDPDAYALWHRAGLGERTAWKGISLDRTAANKLELMLRSLAGSARREVGGAEAAAGYDRMAKAIREGRQEDGGAVLLRGDYGPDTMLEEAWHGWQRRNKIAQSDTIHEVAGRPEFREITNELRSMGYGAKGGAEGRNEITLELMAKALAGDPALKLTADQRFDLVHSFLRAAADEHGDTIFNSMPPVTPEAEGALTEARRSYEAESDAGSRGGAARGQGKGGGSGVQPLARGEEGHAGAAGERERPGGRGSEPGLPEGGAAEGELKFQRVKNAALRPEDSLALPGMENADADREAARGTAQAQLLTDEMRRSQGDISAAAGRMERESPLFHGTGENPTLFQKDDEGNPVARSVESLIEELDKMPAADDRSAVEKFSDWAAHEFDASTGRAAKFWRAIPGLQKGMARANAFTAALAHDFRFSGEPSQLADMARTTGQLAAGKVRSIGVPKPTDWKRLVGNANVARTESALSVRELARSVKEAMPDADARAGIKYWIEAGGDPEKLKKWATIAQQRWDMFKSRPMDARLKEHYHDSIAHYKAAASLDPQQKAVAMQVKRHFDELLKVWQDNGLLYGAARNYVNHLYVRTGEAENLAHLIDMSELNPDPGFIKERVFQTYLEAENHGLIPKNPDIGYLLSAYDAAGSDALATRTLLRNSLLAKSPDGKPLAVMNAVGRWVVARDDEMPQVMRRQEMPEDIDLRDYKEFPDLPQTRGFLFEPTAEDLEGFKEDPKLWGEDPSRVVFKGNLYFHKSIAPQVEDMMRPGWFDRNQTVMQRIGHGILQMNALSKELMTSVIPAPFHVVNIGRRVIEHGANPFRLPKIDMSDTVQRRLVENGLDPLHADAEGLFSTRVLKGVFEGVPGVNVAMDRVHAFSQWMFQDWIPRAGMRLGRIAYESNSRLYGKEFEERAYRELAPKMGDASETEKKQAAKELAQRMVYELSAKQANASVGVINTAFDALPRSKTAKQALRLIFFAPTFGESTGRYVAQGMLPHGRVQAASLLRGLGMVYVTARALNAVLNQGDAKWDKEHAFKVVFHGKEYGVRGAIEDAVHVATDTRQALMNRLSAPFSASLEFATGRDYYGRQRTFPHRVEDAIKRSMPFQIQKVFTTPDISLGESMLSASGIYGSQDRTKAEEMIHRVYVANIPDMPDDPERQAASRRNYQLEDDLRNGKIKARDILDEAKAGKMSLREAWRIVERAQQPRFVNEFASAGIRFQPLHKGDPTVLDVWNAATPQEKMELRPALIRKGESQLPEIEDPTERAEMVKQWRAALAEVPAEHEPPKMESEPKETAATQ